MKTLNEIALEVACDFHQCHKDSLLPSEIETAKRHISLALVKLEEEGMIQIINKEAKDGI